MSATNIIALLGGVALFLFGMGLMGDALKKVAGNKLELVLFKLSNTTLKGILLGTGVTAVIQSSSATSVMVVGFVNSGMMKVKQAIGVILGAILGTSITGWILCLNSIGGSGAAVAQYLNTQVLTGIVALVGIILRMFAKKQRSKNIGEILLGFAVLMYGMSAMSAAIAPLKQNEEFVSFLTRFSNPFLGILAGLLITSILQSASAAVGILQALAVTGAITFDIAFPLIMGIGIGASVPVLLSALGASVNGKRTAFAYLIIDVLGAIICGTLFYAINAFVHFSFMSLVMTMVSIALLNTLFRFATLVFLAPCIGLIEKIVCRMFPDDPATIAEREDMDRLESRFLNHPALAIEQSRQVVDSMAAKSAESVAMAIQVRREFSAKEVEKLFNIESLIDRYEDKLGRYLTKITAKDMSSEQSEEVGMYLHSLSDFERISDHARNIGESAEEIHEKKIVFSAEAMKELQVLENAVGEIVELAVAAFIDEDRSKAVMVEPLEEVIDYLTDTIKSHHIDRVGEQLCTLENGFVFNDLLVNYERISDHCSNIAIALIEENHDDVYAHEYKDNIIQNDDETFRNYYKHFENKYAL